jgi:hypothetical protein
MEAVAKLQAGLVSGLMPTVHTPEVVARYRATTPGTPDRKSRSFRLAWEGLCPTIRAGTGMDKGAFQARINNPRARKSAHRSTAGLRMHQHAAQEHSHTCRIHNHKARK